MSTKPTVEILYFEGCPNWQETQALVLWVASGFPVDIDLQLLEIDDADAATKHRFLGSPSVRVNGIDVEPEADSRDEYVYAFRVYRTHQGFAGQPAEDWVRDALGTSIQ